MTQEQDVRSILLRGASSSPTPSVVLRLDDVHTAPSPPGGQKTLPDFIGDAEALKKLLSLPLTRESATLAIHRVGSALVVDGGCDGAAAQDWPACSRPNGLLRQDPGTLSRVARQLKGSCDLAVGLQRLTVNDDGGVEESKVETPKEEAEAADEAERLAGILSSALAPPEHARVSRPPREYTRVLAWKLLDLELVSGTDVLILGGEATLRVAPADLAFDAESRRIAVLDYYLENVLAGVPHLALCLERRGVVVGSRVVPTAAIPSAFDDRPLFEPRDVEFHAAALLRCLSEHCATDGASYVLRREKNDLRLFDLGSLCDPTQRRWKWLLATLSVRFAHKIASHLRGECFDAAARRFLRGRQRLLLETALELLAEIEDLDGSKHFAMRATLEEQLASTYLHAAPLYNLFPSTELSSVYDDGGLQAVAALDLERATKRLEAARTLTRRLELADSDIAKAVNTRLAEIDTGLADAALALAKRHLERRVPSSLMHELRRARDALQKLPDDRARATRFATIWHLAAAFARGVAFDRYAWSDNGAHASDALALLRDLCGNDDDLDARTVVKTLLEACATERLLAKHDVARAHDRQTVHVDDMLVDLAVGRARALFESLKAARAGFVSEGPQQAAAAMLGDACNDVGQLLLERGCDAVAWFYAAFARLDGDNRARVRLNIAVAERRAAATDKEAATAQASIAEALRHCAMALEDLGGLKTGELWDRVMLETASTNLVLGLTRRKLYFGAHDAPRPDRRVDVAQYQAVVDPLAAALKIHDSLDPASHAAAACHYQLGSFLAFALPPDKRRRATDLQAAKGHLVQAATLFDRHAAHVPRLLCALDLDDLRARDDTVLPLPKRALLALTELLEPRAAVVALLKQDSSATLLALKDRLTLRAKALLALAPKDDPTITQACKAAYRAALTHDALLDALDTVRAALAPLFLFHVAIPPSDVPPSAAEGEQPAPPPGLACDT